MENRINACNLTEKHGGNSISCDHHSYLCLVVLNGAGMLNGERVVKERMKKLLIQDFLVYIKKKKDLSWVMTFPVTILVTFAELC